MARREIIMEEIVELLHQWQKGRSITQIKRSIGMDRKTIRKYILAAKSLGYRKDISNGSYDRNMEAAVKVMRQIKVPATITRSHKETSKYQTMINNLLSRKYIKAKQVYQVLKRNHGYNLSYSSFKRYMRIRYPKQIRNCIRIELTAGEEAQVDFGGVGKMYDIETGRKRRAYAFVMSLSYSRLPYVEFVFDQGQATWVKCHIKAFKFFKGVPKRIVLDNLKSGVIKPDTYDPILNKAYAECARHYGFIIDPARIRQARHKGKVERKIPVVRQQFISVYDYRNLYEANSMIKEWSINAYGMEIHGTTKKRPAEVFYEEERRVLQQLPEEEFDMPLWKKAKVHIDHHIVFKSSYYSLPTRYIGKEVWVRGGMKLVQIFYEGELIKTHYKSCKKGERRTDDRDYPEEKSRYTLRSKAYYKKKALIYGKNVCQLVTRIMSEHAYRNLRKIQGIFRLTETYGKEAVDKACKRCLYYEDYNMRTIKNILEQKLYEIPLEDDGNNENKAFVQEELIFLRRSEYFNH